jgi:non-specific serine/threonine protein kinase
VPGKGYRFVAPVEVVASRQSSAVPATPAPPDTRRHNLPAELTSFVGRRQELVELPRVVRSSRLLSLTGAGGVGKTRLALRLARDLVNEFRDGVWLIDLAPLSLPDLVAQTIATALGIREGAQRSARDVLLDTLRDRELLLVLDTCEHLIDSCAELVEVLLRQAPALRIVVTSREALGVSGENVYRVPSLSLPEALTSVPEELIASEAMQLFVERASAVDPTFTATSHNGNVIARLCRRLDGIPLAIELAAARIAVLSPEQIEARLQDRFRLLTGGARRAVARQRTLEATVDWSYHLLSDAERQLLSRLSVFPATWSLEAAEHVCGGDGISKHDVLDLLSRLVGKSVVVVDSEFADARRYRLLETVRQYARERLVQSGAADRLNERHFEYFFGEFRGVLPILRHHDQLPCLRRLQMEQENVRLSLDWALTSAPHAVKGVELAGALFWFWTKRGLYEEGKLWLERALAVGGDVPRGLRARVLIGLTHMHHFQGRSFETVIAEALSLGRDEGDAWAMSFALFMQGLAALQRGDYEEAQALALEAREAANASGEAVQHGGPLLLLGKVAESSGDYERAQQLYDESIEVHRRVGDKWGLSILLSAAAGLRIVQKDFDQARIQASEAMSLCQELDDPRGIAWSLDMFASLLAAAGHDERAARLWGAADRLLESVGGSLTPEISGIRDRYGESVKTSLGVGAFETARAEGRAMPLVHAIALARERAPSPRLSRVSAVR